MKTLILTHKDLGKSKKQIIKEIVDCPEKKYWRRCKYCRYMNYVKGKDYYTFTCTECGKSNYNNDMSVREL